MGKEIAIFGATGLIGSNIIKLLENDNADKAKANRDYVKT